MLQKTSANCFLPPPQTLYSARAAEPGLCIPTSVSSLEQTWTSPPASSEPRMGFQRSVFLAWPSRGSLRKQNRAVRTAGLSDLKLEHELKEPTEQLFDFQAVTVPLP